MKLVLAGVDLGDDWVGVARDHHCWGNCNDDYLHGGETFTFQATLSDQAVARVAALEAMMCGGEALDLRAEFEGKTAIGRAFMMSLRQSDDIGLGSTITAMFRWDGLIVRGPAGSG